MGGITMPILLALLGIGAVSPSNWAIETSCPLTNLSVPTYLPHPLNCNLYLFCTGNSLMPFLQRCPKGQTFDKHLGYCTDSSRTICIQHNNPYRTLSFHILDDKMNDSPCSKSDYMTYVPHPTNCSRFYECSLGLVVEMQCPAGSYFIPHLELCGRSRQTCDVSLHSDSSRLKRESRNIAPPKCPTISTGYSMRLPHQDCDYFYQCSHSVPVEVRCPPGLHFNPDSQECDLPARSKCNKGSNIDGVGETEKGKESIHCPKHYGFQESIRHPDRCDRFYSCASGHSVLKQCPLGLVFNPVTQTCDWPKSVPCLNDNLDGVQNPGLTYENCKHGSLLPNPSDCSSFYQCVWGRPVLIECPEPLYFNPELGVCDWSWNVECEDDSSSSSSESSSSSSEGDDSAETNTEDPDLDDSSEDMSIEAGEEEEDQEYGIPAITPKAERMKQKHCPAVERMHECEMPKCPPYNYGLVVEFYNPYNCSEFFKCNWGKAIKFSCPSGLHYNRRLQVCDYPETADCCTCHEEPLGIYRDLYPFLMQSFTGMPYLACKHGITRLPVPNACESYYTCHGGALRIRTCPKGLHFNPVLGFCDLPRNSLCGVYREVQNSSCPEIDPHACSLGRESIFVNPKNCSLYYECEEGGLVLKVCSKGEEFNAVKKMCDEPKNARCKSCVEGTEKKTECGSSIYGQSTIHPDPKNCNAYYRCEWGTRVPYKCPDGLYFNRILEVCDLPERSGCTI